MSTTPAQQQAVIARGNVLVMAGAGTGKTRTLVDRCLGCLLDESPAASLDELLLVTFTDAAAAEMRQRIRARLEDHLQTEPGHFHLQEQLSLFDTAFIGTLHSFCLQLIRHHFYELQLDPQLAILAKEEAPLLAQETLDKLLAAHYRGPGPQAEAVQRLIEAQARGSDQPIRALILRLHHYTQTLAEPEIWFQQQSALFAATEPAQWLGWLRAAARDWKTRWFHMLQQAVGNPVAERSAQVLGQMPDDCSRERFAQALAEAAESAALCVYGKKKHWVAPFEEFFAETQFLRSLAETTSTGDPLAEDWEWVRQHMLTLLGLARDFTSAFGEAKRELGVVDFHDLEQFALRLLWDPVGRQPTAVAELWRRKLRFIFVDEYQDINAAQDKIIECLSRGDGHANRFLVGDVKQSIYRFRLANPYIFQAYVQSWSRGAGTVIPLVDNFRSRQGILEFVNSLFPLVMRRELGGVAYDEMARLRFGNPQQRHQLALGPGVKPCVELRLRVRHGHPAAGHEADDPDDTLPAEILDLEEADKEARLVALRLLELRDSRLPVWDDHLREFRPVKWSDMAVLLRSPGAKFQRYAREFAKLQVPLSVARAEFYQSLEISDMLSLLQVLDNPLQDVPALAVLRSPLVGLTVEELATIRLARKGRFWSALLHWHQRHLAGGGKNTPPTAPDAHGELNAGISTGQKVGAFLDRYRRWRRLVREVSLSRCLDTVLGETNYRAWLLTQPRGEQRHANLERFLALAFRFDQFQRQSLFRFLRFIEAQIAAEAEPEASSGMESDAVRLLSIHQSKGLEFPVVVVADLAKRFNFSDLSADIILDEEYGLCPQVKPPGNGRRYPSLPHWLAGRRQTRELLGEELRLLYVALTRARDFLLLTGSISEKQLRQIQTAANEQADSSRARSYWDWLQLWLASRLGPVGTSAASGVHEYFSWTIQEEEHLAGPVVAPQPPVAGGSQASTLEARLRELARWEYPLAAATRTPAKSSVTLLRRRAAARLEPGTYPPFVTRPNVLEIRQTRIAHGSIVAQASKPAVSRVSKPASHATNQQPGAAPEIGSAHHTFLELAALDIESSVQALRAEAERLQARGALSAEESALLDFPALSAYWNSDLGQAVRARAQKVRRELAFTARFSPAELAALTGEPLEAGLDQELVVVQGVADLVVLLPTELWLVDYKTDTVSPTSLDHKTRLYTPQLRIYAHALGRIYRRPVAQAWLYFLAAHKSVRVELA